jgi:hypothetical protein
MIYPCSCKLESRISKCVPMSPWLGSLLTLLFSWPNIKRYVNLQTTCFLGENDVYNPELHCYRKLQSLYRNAVSTTMLQEVIREMMFPKNIKLSNSNSYTHMAVTYFSCTHSVTLDQFQSNPVLSIWPLLGFALMPEY